MIVCTCLICKQQWEYSDDEDESLIRASCSPCGHQGLFRVTKKEIKDEDKNI